ncbi:hypothetical protein HK103_002027, partial [Boothiomyces macroporosus]
MEWDHSKRDSGVSILNPAMGALPYRMNLLPDPSLVQIDGLIYSEQCLLVEYAMMRDYCPDGIYVLPLMDYLYKWNGVMFVQ